MRIKCFTLDTHVHNTQVKSLSINMLLSLLTYLFKDGRGSRKKRISFMVHRWSDLPMARISKWSHIALLPVEIIGKC